MKTLNTCLIIEQLKTALHEKTDKSLCVRLKITPQTLSSWKRRNSIPLETIFNLAQKHELSLDWLLTGKEANASRDTAESMLLAGFKELTDKQKMQAVTFVGNLANGITASTPSQSIGGNGVNVAGGIRIEK